MKQSLINCCTHVCFCALYISNSLKHILTIYVCCADTAELKKYNSSNIDELNQDAIAFADNIDPKKLGSLIKELDSRVRQLLDVAPQIPEDGNVKKTENHEQMA